MLSLDHARFWYNDRSSFLKDLVLPYFFELLEDAKEISFNPKSPFLIILFDYGIIDTYEIDSDIRIFRPQLQVVSGRKIDLNIKVSLGEYPQYAEEISIDYKDGETAKVVICDLDYWVVRR